ncbi:tyrosine recombinase XerC [Virgisporangium aurantiacum]|uniref:Tyrosine recombinase XerC n=1 Tax=Virgisporangium aurantiacum TaxID=175570 RepID=A0A8J3ZEX1_9ACTN|nr:tyrosine recombinase XerC [Virgisporangium aurantiacum]
MTAIVPVEGEPARTAAAVVTLPAGLGEPLLAATAGWLREHTDAPTTQRAYLRDLHTWLTWCRDADVDPRAARRPDAAAWAEDLATAPSSATGRPLAASTRARMLAAVSSWYGYLLSLDEDLVARNPIAPLRRPTVATNQSATVGLTAHQARALIAAADADPHRAALRTRAAIRLLLEVGLRVAEVCGLDVADYGHNRGHRTLRYIAKGQRTMTRAVHPDTAAALDAYLAHRAVTAGIAVEQLSGPLLVTASGARLDQPALFRLVRRLARAAQLPAWRQLSPHSLRHSFATIYLDHGGNLRDLQDALGHASPATTRRYDRDRHNLNRDATHTVGAALALPTPTDSGS